MSHQSFQSQYSSYSHNSARDTQNSAATSTTTLFGNPSTQPFSTPSSTPVNGGPVEASNNVLNKRADKDTSLFQRCVNLRARLLLIPGFERWIQEEDAEADADDDPVTLLWRIFRRGYPLMDVYNALNPAVPLSIDESKITEKNRSKSAAFKFIRACVEELKFPADECPILSDLFGDDTTGFVKVLA
jgi:cell division control protein 24